MMVVERKLNCHAATVTGQYSSSECAGFSEVCHTLWKMLKCAKLSDEMTKCVGYYYFLTFVSLCRVSYILCFVVRQFLI